MRKNTSIPSQISAEYGVAITTAGLDAELSCTVCWSFITYQFPLGPVPSGPWRRSWSSCSSRTNKCSSRSSKMAS